MLSCHEYDYIELVCTFQYPLQVTLKSSQVRHVKALDTARNDQHDECLKALEEGKVVLIRLDDILEIRCEVKNPHFESVTFA
ncbi:Rho-binding antiterminator [Marinomonas dokdonensis]|uniref:Rho-binding antiterminator n=1 Tax=Marinomonas dokdonensis TaxID=328224 RepID=UPI0040558CA5